MEHWIAAAKTVEAKTLEYHGEDRASALKAHHENVLELSNSFDWKLASAYDRKTRDLTASDTRHDLSIIDYNLVQKTSTHLSMLDSKLIALQSSQHSTIFQPSPSSSGPLNSPSPSRRFSPFDQSGRRSRSSRPSAKCFRCGIIGHMSATCGSSSTSAGLPCASWARNPGGRTGFLIDGSSGQPFCFGWAQNSSCRFADRCKNIHRCSICGDAQHGAVACPR